MTRTRSGRVFGRVLHDESKHRTSASFCYLSNIDIFQYVTQIRTRTRQNTLYFIMSRTCTDVYTLISKVHVCIKVTLKGELSSSHSSSVCRGSNYESRGCELESHCGQGFFILYFFAFRSLLTGRLSPYKWNQAWHSKSTLQQVRFNHAYTFRYHL